MFGAPPEASKEDIKPAPEASQEDSKAAVLPGGVGLFGRRYFICKTRKRLTDDGGASILATKNVDSDF